MFNCLFVKDGVILIGGVEKVQAIRTYFDRELECWVAVVRSGQEYSGERSLAATRAKAALNLRDGIAQVEYWRKRGDEAEREAGEKRTAKKKERAA